MFPQEAKKRAKEKAEAQKQVEAILTAAAGGDEGKEGKGGEENAPAAPMDPVKRGKALSKKIKKLETVKAKKDAGETINAVGLGFLVDVRMVEIV